MSSPSRDYIRDPNLSLGEKLRRRYREKPAIMRLQMTDDPAFFNRWGPWVLLFLLCGAGGWGTLVAMPVLYAGWGEGWLVAGRVWVAVMVVEATVNWSLTRWVSSEYRPHIHGTRPPSFPSAEHAFASHSSDTANSSREKSERSGTSGTSVTANSLGSKCEPYRTSAASDTTNSSGENGRNDSVRYRERQDQTCRHNNNTDGMNASSDSGTHSSRSRKADDPQTTPPSGPRRRHDGYSYRMLVAVALPTAEGHVERKAFPYWSWVRCLMCGRERPPRCHHCTLCGVCVLKRDHHCYLTGSCIGVNNHRFFLVFLFWGLQLTAFGALHMLPYTFYHVVPDYNVSLVDFLPPVSLVRAVLGQVSPVISLLALLFWLLLFFLLMAASMLANFIYMFAIAQTSFERQHRIRVIDTRPLSGKLRAVFGDHWWLNVLLPTYPWIRPHEDAVLWPHVKPC